MDPITIALIAIGFNFISSMVSKSAANKLEEYKKAAQKNAQEQMLEMSRRLYCERLESERELHRFLLEQQRKGNAENLSIIALNGEKVGQFDLTKAINCSSRTKTDRSTLGERFTRRAYSSSGGTSRYGTRALVSCSFRTSIILPEWKSALRVSISVV